MSDVILKTGMLVNGAGEVVGWVNAGEECEMKEGDVVVSHPKTAEKLGLAEQYAEMKAANKPVKTKKVTTESANDATPRIRKVIPKTGNYTVVKATAAQLKEGEVAGVRNELLSKLLNGTSFEAFWESVPEKFEHPGRDGTMKEHTTSGLVGDAIYRGMTDVAVSLTVRGARGVPKIPAMSGIFIDGQAVVGKAIVAVARPLGLVA